jgi:hypothetical protein
MEKSRPVKLLEIPRFSGTDRERSDWNVHAAQSHLISVRELPALRFFGGIGSNDRVEELQDP